MVEASDKPGIEVTVLKPYYLGGRYLFCVQDCESVNDVLDQLVAAKDLPEVLSKEDLVSFAQGRILDPATLIRDVNPDQSVPRIYVQLRARDVSLEAYESMPIPRGVSGGGLATCGICQDAFPVYAAEGVACTQYSQSHFMCFQCCALQLESTPHTVHYDPTCPTHHFAFTCHASCGGSMPLHTTRAHEIHPSCLEAFKERLTVCCACGSLADLYGCRCRANHTLCDVCLAVRVEGEVEMESLPYDGALVCGEAVVAGGEERCQERTAFGVYRSRLPRALADRLSDHLISQRESLIAGYEQNMDPNPDTIRRFIHENILNLRCPSCRKTFQDHENCPCVTCSTCAFGFCARCLRTYQFCPCYDRDFPHDQWHRKRRARRVVAYLSSYDMTEDALAALLNDEFIAQLKQVELDVEDIKRCVRVGREPTKDTLLRVAGELEQKTTKTTAADATQIKESGGDADGAAGAEAPPVEGGGAQQRGRGRARLGGQAQARRRAAAAGGGGARGRGRASPGE